MFGELGDSLPVRMGFPLRGGGPVVARRGPSAVYPGKGPPTGGQKGCHIPALSDISRVTALLGQVRYARTAAPEGRGN